MMTPEGQALLRGMAHQLAGRIEGLDSLTPAQRCDLRTLPMEMLALADAEGGHLSPEAVH